MKRSSKINALTAQAALEYMLLLAVAVAVVLVGIRNYLPRTEKAAEIFFNETANVIFGKNPVGVPIPGGWGAWTACPPCGIGNTQSRACNNPPPSGGGQPCLGQSVRNCVDIPCQPQDCQWGAWSGCACSPTPGTSYENRNCICPSPPTPVGAFCQGPASQPCPFIPCPIPGCAWTPWGECCNVACCTECYTCVDALGCGLPDLTIQCGAGGEQMRTCECAPGSPASAYCPPDINNVQTERMCPGFDCSCLPTTFPVADPRCQDVPIPMSAGTQASTYPCILATDCSGGVTVACTDGQWNFLSESCGVRCGDSLCATQERASCDPLCTDVADDPLGTRPPPPGPCPGPDPMCPTTNECRPCCGDGVCDVAYGERCNNLDWSAAGSICQRDCGTCYCGDGACTWPPDASRGNPGREDCDNCLTDCPVCPTCAVRGGVCCPYGCAVSSDDMGSVTDPVGTCFQCCMGSGCNSSAPSCGSLGGTCCQFGCSVSSEVEPRPTSCTGGTSQCCTTSNCNPPPTCGSLGGSCCQYGCVSGDVGVTSDCANFCCTGGCAAQTCASAGGSCCSAGCVSGDQGQLNCGSGNSCCTGGCLTPPCQGACCGYGCAPIPNNWGVPSSNCSSGMNECCMGDGVCYNPAGDSCGGVGGWFGETPFCCNSPSTTCASGDTPYPSNDCDVCCLGGNTSSQGFCT